MNNIFLALGLFFLVLVFLSILGDMIFDLNLNKSPIVFLFIGAICFFIALPLCFLAEKKKPNFTLVKKDWSCVESHQETYTSMIMVGKIMVPQVHTSTVCDEYRRQK